MTYLLLGLMLISVPVQADMWSTLSAMDAEDAANRARAQSASTEQKVDTLSAEVQELKKIIKELVQQQEEKNKKATQKPADVKKVRKH